MDPTRLADIQFKQARHGYEPAEVDSYVDSVGSTVAQLQGQIRDLRHRLHEAETRANETGQAEETLRRTLVLAQRTADAAIAEARAEADEISTDARTRAEQMVRDAEYDSERRVREAETQATMLRAEAEKEARRVVEATRQPLLDEIRELEQVRNFLSDDISLLEEHIDLNRHRIRSSVDQLQSLLDSPDGLQFAPTPALSGAAMTDEGAATLFENGATWDATAADLWDTDSSGTVVADEPSPVDAGPDRPAPAILLATAMPAISATAVSAPDVAPAEALIAEAVSVEALIVDVTSEEAAPDEVVVESSPVAAAPATVEPDSDGPPTESMDIIDLTDSAPGAGDSFLDELRKAVGDEPPAEDPVFTAFFDGDDSDDRRPRFGRRR